MDGNLGIPKEPPQRVNEPLERFTRDPDGRIWIGTDRGVIQDCRKSASVRSARARDCSTTRS